MKALTKPPYEINESGWGEFDITVKIYFMDPNEKPVGFITQRECFFFFSSYRIKYDIFLIFIIILS